LDTLNVFNSFLEENDIKWENYNGLCTDGAQSMSRRNTGLQALVRKEDLVLFGHLICFIDRLFTRVVNYVTNSPLRGRLFAK
jgi:hypothetical protein